MDDLPKTAILLIYPDGEIDKCMITSHRYHIEYFKDLLTKSPRFAKICGRCNYDTGLHYEFDEKLTQNGVIAMYNFNVRDIVEEPSLIYEDLPSFIVCLPKTLGNEEQLGLLEYFYENYPKRKTSFAQIKDENNKNKFGRLDDITYEEVQDFINKERNILNRNKLERGK